MAGKRKPPPPPPTPNRYRWLFGPLKWAARLLLIFMVLSIALTVVLRWLPPPTTSWILQRSTPVQYHWMPIESISPQLQLAVIAGEDQKFPRHNGFDFESLRQALEDYRHGKPLRGASTISQQVAKNLFLWSGRSLIRKGLEAWFTLLIELLWDKPRILEMYVNIVEFGGPVVGAEAASRYYFDRPAARLSPEQAALLAAVLPNPHIYRVEAPSGHVRQRQRWILRQMRQLGGTRYLDQL